MPSSSAISFLSMRSAHLVYVSESDGLHAIAVMAVKREHRGADQREQIRALNDIVRAQGIPAGSTLCFSQHGERHVEGEPLPGF